jgi:hypothetical protein
VSGQTPSRGMALNRAALLVTRAKRKVYKLKPETGMNLAGVELAIPAITEEDSAYLGFLAAPWDTTGNSFAQTREDVRGLIGELEKRMKDRPLPTLMLKIETLLAVRNLPRLIVKVGAHMPIGAVGAAISPSRLALNALRSFRKRSSGCARRPIFPCSG